MIPALRPLLIPVLLLWCFHAASVLAVERDDRPAEALGWKLAVKGYTFSQYTFFEMMDAAKLLGLRYLEINVNQKLKPGSTLAIGPEMDAQALVEMRQKMAACGVQAVSCGVIHVPPKEEAKQRQLFAWLKGLGADTLVIESDPTELTRTLAAEYAFRIAIHNHADTYPPETLLKVVHDLPATFGACCDIGHLCRRNLIPAEQVRVLKDRIIQFHFKDIAPADGSPSEPANGIATPTSKKMVDVAWGTGRVDLPAVMQAMKDVGFKGLISIEYDHKPPVGELIPALARDIAYFDSVVKSLR